MNAQNLAFINYMLAHPGGKSGWDIVSHFGISWPQFAAIKQSVIRNGELVNWKDPKTGLRQPLAYRYDARLGLYFIGSEALGGTERDYRSSLKWTCGYSITRCGGIVHQLAAFKGAYPQRAAKSKAAIAAAERYIANAEAELHAVLAQL